MFISPALLALVFFIAMSCLAQKLDLDWSSRVEQAEPDMEEWENDEPEYCEDEKCIEGHSVLEGEDYDIEANAGT
ncbi:hypothetical protein BLS_002487 [Venturia inaequalis]|uniref:Uncharacterized protein n=1 Tax=Venturia inaequalis TaxID=5025 RepID=A0A8H3UVS6_VENIN|nr:hypothetical protein BLS_002487 [Venturia inaequalis]KAE9989282.1 hypothetical protein EG327_002900 [Venturia inaequalis]